MWGFRRSISSSAQRIFLSWAAMFSPWELGGTGVRGRSDGQHHGDRGPVTGHGLHDGDSAPMILAHHAPRKREPEPPAAPLRGEPRRERATALRGGHAAAVVLDEDLDLAPLGAPAHGDLDPGGDRLAPPLRRVPARGSLAQVRRPSEERGERRPELVRGLLGHGGPQRALLPGHDRPESHESEDEKHEYDAELDVGNPAEPRDERRLAVMDVPAIARISETPHRDGRVT